MARPPSKTLTPREAEIMDVLWQRGSATAEQVRTAMSGGPHDSTVRTLLRVLESKGYVGHDAETTPYLYRPRTARHKAQRKGVQSLLQRLFGGSAQSLVLRLIEDEQITPEQVEELLQSAKKCRPKRRPAEGGSL